MMWIVRVMLFVLSLIGSTPNDSQLETHVWSMVGAPITVDNVARYVDAVVSVPYNQFDPTDKFDTCGIWVTFIQFDDGTMVLQLERDCQAVEHSRLSVYAITNTGFQFSEY